MTLKVIGAGYGRTGTMSTFTALNQLGLRCYHMVEVIMNKENKTHLDFWRRVANSPPGQQQDWDSVFKGYEAAVDNPACCVWKELMQAYPDAKVLLTLHPRGPDAWYESTIDTIYFTENRWQFKVLNALLIEGRYAAAGRYGLDLLLHPDVSRAALLRAAGWASRARSDFGSRPD